VDLTWNPSPSADVQDYKVYRSEISGGPYTSISGTITALDFTDSSVLSSRTYFYVVTAINSNGIESDPSAEVTAQIPP
jgi:fibronectin type 3 domain-containing protein